MNLKSARVYLWKKQATIIYFTASTIILSQLQLRATSLSVIVILEETIRSSQAFLSTVVLLLVYSNIFYSSISEFISRTKVPAQNHEKNASIPFGLILAQRTKQKSIQIA